MPIKTVTITKNAKLQRDADGLYWLLIETADHKGMFNLPVEPELDEILQQFMEEQELPMIDSQN